MIVEETKQVLTDAEYLAGRWPENFRREMNSSFCRELTTISHELGFREINLAAKGWVKAEARNSCADTGADEPVHKRKWDEVYYNNGKDPNSSHLPTRGGLRQNGCEGGRS